MLGPLAPRVLPGLEAGPLVHKVHKARLGHPVFKVRSEQQELLAWPEPLEQAELLVGPEPLEQPELLA